MSNNELKEAFSFADKLDPADTENKSWMGEMPDGRKVTTWYAGKGNHDIHIDGVYKGTIWFG